jgi:acetolactate synthase-1/2/3 large subunit
MAINKLDYFGSDLIIDILVKNHIEYVSFNPGATFRGLHDSLVNSSINQSPQLLMCCHEEISVAIAHGYSKAANKPMAVFIHANIGLQHASMAIFNAWCDRVPMIIIGGVGPLASSERRPWIDWIHTSNNQESIIRDYVKWTDQPNNLASTSESLYRAFKITNTEPKAPVYVGIDLTIQEETISEPTTTEDPEKFAPAMAASVDRDMVTTIINELCAAKFPLIVTDYTGRNPEIVEKLVKLAEHLEIGVVDQGGRYNFPNTHRCCLTGLDSNNFKQVDYILALDVADLSSALGEIRNQTYFSYLQDHVKITHITLADNLISKWAADYHKLYPVNRTLASDSASFLKDILGEIKKTTLPKFQRIHKIKEIHDTLRSSWAQQALDMKSKFPIEAPAALYEIWSIIKDEDWILANNGGVNISKWAKKLWNFSIKGCHVGESGGAGLGYGLGAAIGVALANKDTKKICINLQTDGDFLFTPSALWTASHYQIPLLIIMMNNRSYNNSKEHAVLVASKRSRNVNKSHIGTCFDTPVNFSMLANSFGIASGTMVENLAEVKPELAKAINYIKQNRKPYLLDVIIK